MMKTINLSLAFGLLSTACVTDTPDLLDDTSELGTTTIRGHKNDRRRLTGDEVVLAPADLSTTPIEAQVDGAIYLGIGAADGSFRIDGVPRNRPFWLRVGTNWYLTRERTVDVGVDILGRPDAVTATAGTRLVLDVDGLTPVTAGDDFQIAAPDAGVGFYSTASFSNPITANPPTLGDTVLAGAEFPFDADPALGTTAYPLIQASRGDTFTFAQLTTRQAGAVGYQAVSRGLTAPLEMTQGAATGVHGTLAVLPTITTPVDFRLGAFEAQTTAIGPGTAVTTSSVVIDPAPAGRVVNLGAPDLVVANFAPGGTDQVIPFAYGNPYPTGWRLHGIATTFFAVPYIGPTPDGGTTTRTTTLFSLAWEFLRNNRVRMAPVTSPPREIEIDGRARTGDVQITGVTPVVSWNAPCDGRPSSYQVRVVRLAAVAPFTTVVARLLVSDHTDRIRIPAGVLIAGEHYQVQVRAVATAEHADDSKLEPSFVPPAGIANATSITIRVE